MRLETLWLVLAVLTLGVGFFLVLTLAGHRKGIRRENRILSLTLGLYSCMLFEYALLWTGALARVPHFTALSFSFYFLYGPLFWLYARSLAGRSALPGRRLAPHFLPFAAFVLYQSPFLLSSAAAKLAFLKTELLDGQYFQSVSYQVITAVQLVHLAAYEVSVRRLKAGGRSEAIGNGVDGDETKAIRSAWLQRIGRLFLGFIVVMALDWLARISGQPSNGFLCLGLGITMAAFIYAIGFQGFRAPETFSGPIRTRTRARYETSGLNRNRARIVCERVESLMDRQHLYRDPDLRLATLAAAAGVAPHILSQCLNQTLGMNFSRFVNQYRVSEARQLLVADGARSVLDIAVAVGFNSKNAFYGAFRRHLGHSVGEFRRSQDPATVRIPPADAPRDGGRPPATAGESTWQGPLPGEAR